MAVQDYSTTAASNNAAPPNGAPEGMTPGSVNDTIRQIMADVALESQVNRVRYLNSVAGTNTITASMTPSLTAYSAGMLAVFNPANTNTGATTLNINSLGALDVFRQGGIALAAGDLAAGIPAVIVLDSGADDWILLNPTSVGWRDIPRTDDTVSTTILDSMRGTLRRYTGVGSHVYTYDTAQTYTAGGVMTLVNEGSGSITIAGAGSGTIRWYNGSGTVSVATRTLAVGGVATIYFLSTTVATVWGTGLS
jgi:hypothetical protein